MSVFNIIKQWKNIKIEKRISPLKKWKLKKLVKNGRELLETKVALSPYELLLRFGIGRHQETRSIWAFPTLSRKENGRGYYINLRKKVMQVMRQADIDKLFYGMAYYRVDMIDHVQKLLTDQSFEKFSSFSLHSFHRLEPLTETEWLSDHSLANDFQCILVFDKERRQDLCQLNHSIRTGESIQSSLPCYDVSQIWSEKQFDQVIAGLGTDRVALGVSKSLKTVDLAIAFWRCRKFAA